MANPRSEYKKAWIARRKAAGICVQCGKHPAVKDRTNCQDCLDKAAERARLKRRRIRAEAMDAYGGVCVCCGETAVEFLTLDHINGGGRKHRREFVGYGYPTSGAPFYEALRKAGWPDEGLQVLCWNCNVAKYQYGVCPHQQT